jgi:tetratricopeptide (TPR) repeat protein
MTVPSFAGDPASKRAKDQMKWGLEAARHGYWLEALNRFLRADRLVPNRSKVLNNIAVALEASGRFEDALSAYETALTVAPNDPVVRRNFTQFKEFYDSHVAPIPVEDDAGAAGAQDDARDTGEADAQDDVTDASEADTQDDAAEVGATDTKEDAPEVGAADEQDPATETDEADDEDAAVDAGAADDQDDATEADEGEDNE